MLSCSARITSYHHHRHCVVLIEEWRWLCKNGAFCANVLSKTALPVPSESCAGKDMEGGGGKDVVLFIPSKDNSITTVMI